MERQKIIFPPKIRKQRENSFSQALFRFMLLVFLGAVIYILFFSSLMQISSIKISGNKYIENKLILNEINSQIEGKYLKLLAKNNLLLFGKNNIKNILLNKFRQIRNVQVKKDFPSELSVIIQEREMKMAITNGGNYYLLDENGQAYDEISFDPDLSSENLMVLTDRSGKEINLGNIILERNYISYILSIKDKLKNDLDLETDNNFWTPSLVSNDIRVKTKNGWDIYFNAKVEINKEIEMLKTVLNDEIGESQKSNLEYIDLRIDNKIYYKFKQAEEKIEKQEKS